MERKEVDLRKCLHPTSYRGRTYKDMKKKLTMRDIRNAYTDGYNDGVKQCIPSVLYKNKTL